MDCINPIYASRRQKIFDEMPENSYLLFHASTKMLRNGDASYLFRQDSNFYYISGFQEDEAICVLIKKGIRRFIVFCKESTQTEARWQGARLGISGARAFLGVDEAYEYHLFESKKLELFEGLQCLPKTIVHESRLIKDDVEIDLMRRAALISVNAHRRAMKFCRPNIREYELEAEYLHEFVRCGARAPAYTSIVGAGGNACVLHYIDNQDVLKDGDLVLVDAGAEYQYYAADITRVFPVNGVFTEPQKIIYELVLQAQMAAIEYVAPQKAWGGIQACIVHILSEGLVDLGIISQKEDYKKYYMHGSGHWLGLDVHDVGEYKIGGEWRNLQAGMVLTVEPGLYFPKEDLSLDPRWRGIGIRIEDDVLVTKNGFEVLTIDLPKSVDEIEAVMKHG